MINQSPMINMIKQQLRTGDVLNESILDLYEVLPREDFVPTEFKEFAYSDLQIPLKNGQRMLTPLEEGQILQSLDLQGHETVLEIGTGTGFLTAMLSRLCKKVITLEYFEEFSKRATQKLKEYNCHNVEIITADGSKGWLEGAPFDTIVYTGGLESLSKTQELQLMPGGKLFAIIGKNPVFQGQLFSLDHDNQWSKEIIFETDIPLLIDKLKTKKFVF